MTTPAKPGSPGPTFGHIQADIALTAIAHNTKQTVELLTKIASMARLGGSAAAAGSVPGLSSSASVGGAGGGVSGGLSAAIDRNFKERQERTQRWASGLSQMGFTGTGSGMNRMASFAGGMSKAGVPGAMLAARAAPIAGAIVGGIDTAAHASRIMSDHYSTGDMKARALARMLPGGETLQGWYDSFSGRAAGMERASVESRVRGIGVQGGLDISAYALSHNPQQAGLAATAGAYQRGSAVTAGVFDRTTGAGRTAYEDAQRMLPYRQATAKAERDMAASSAQRLSAQKELNRLEAKENELTATQVKLKRQIDEGGSGVEFQELLERHKNTSAELQGINMQRRQALESVAGFGREEAGARGELAKARIRESLLGKADNLTARAERSEASAGRLGDMDPFQRAQGLQAIKLLEGGASPDVLGPEMKAAARALDPDSYDQLIKQHGLGTAEFKSRQAENKRGFEGNYGSLYREADTLREQAGQEEYRADTKAAGEIAKAGANLAVEFARLSKQYTDSAIDAFRKEILSGKNLQ